MDIQNLFFQILPFLAIVSIFIGWLQNRRDKKLGIEKEEKPSRLKLWFKKTYLYKIFVERASLRPISSAFLYAIFVVPACFICLFGVVFLNIKPPVQLKDIKPISGYITKVVWIQAGRGSDYIRLKRQNGNETTYLIHMDKNLYETLTQIKNRRNLVYVYPYHRYYINLIGTKHIVDIKYNNKFLKGYFKENISKKDNSKKRLNITNIYNFFYSTWFGLKIALVGLFFIFLLNYKEKPIHRLNRMKKYLKDKNQKKEK